MTDFVGWPGLDAERFPSACFMDFVVPADSARCLPDFHLDYPGRLWAAPDHIHGDVSNCRREFCHR